MSRRLTQRLVPSAVDGRSYHPGQKGARNGRRPFCPAAGAELAEAGYPPAELGVAVERAGRAYVQPSREIVGQLAAELLGPGGRLAAEKTFDLRDVLMAVAPHLHGLPVSSLDTAVQKLLSPERAIALPAAAGARQPVWAAACVLEDERRVTELAGQLVERSSPAVPADVAAQAVLQTELGRRFRLNEGQIEAAKGLLTSGHSLDLIIGVAGSGKTSALSAVRAGFEAAGYKVIGAATSGQAAKALEDGIRCPLPHGGFAHLAPRPPPPSPRHPPCARPGRERHDH